MDLFDEGEITTADKIGKPEETLRREMFQNAFKSDRTEKAGGGMLAQPSADGSRQEYATSTVKTEKFKYPISNQFGTFYSDKKPEVSKAVIKQEEKTKFINQLVSDANAGDKHVSISEIGEKVKKKFKLKNAKSINITSFPSLELLESRADKIDKVLRDMLISDKPLNGFWHNVISERTGVPINKPGNLRILEQSPTYKSIRDQGLDLLKINYSRKSFNYLHDFSLSDQLSKALEIAKGNPTYIGLGGEKVRTALPSNKIMEFALRSWNTNKGSKDGPVQFFDKNGKPITWKKGIKLPYKNVSFSYNGKMHKKSDLNTDYMKKFFPEVYNNQIAINNLSVTNIDNPFKKGSKISVKDLIKKIQVDNYKWSPRFPTLEILHGKKGVAAEPFSNLTYATRDINQLENSINASLKAGNIKPAEANRLIKTIRSTISGKTGDDLREAIISRQLNLAKQKNLTFPKIGEIGIDEFKKTLASFGDGTCAVTFGKKKRDGGRIGYQTGTPGLNRCIESGVKNFNDGKFKTKDQAMDAARLLSGGKNVLKTIGKYGVLPEAAYVAGESIFRTVLGEKPLDAIKKSIDSFTFGLTDFTSGIEAAKFGKDADRKLAVDKFKESQAKVNKLEKQIAGLDQIGEAKKFGYGVDNSEIMRMTKEKLEAAKKELEQNYVSPDLVQYIDRKAENIADAQEAKSPIAKSRFKENMKLNAINLAKARDTSQMDLNVDMFPNFRNYVQSEEGQKEKLFINTPDEVIKNIVGEEGIGFKKQLTDAYKMENLKNRFGAEQIYGTQGVFSQPLAGGGRAGFKLGSLRKGLLALIDKSVKSKPKDTTTDLNALIKKTLDEDFFDKKDRMIDQLNLSLEKQRRLYGPKEKKFEEPHNLQQYLDITESNFKTKKGPFFDKLRAREKKIAKEKIPLSLDKIMRDQKAGGGLLKQAGDRSGPPPESGPNSQGLQGLLNRVKKV